MEKSNAHILYVCHDGVIPPLGQSQVLNLLLQLRRDHGYRISLLSFEKDSDMRTGTLPATRGKLADAGIDWTILRYHRKPTGIATLFDVLHGFVRGLLITRRQGTTILHARSYVSCSVAFLIKLVTGLPLIFDMRGFWADEKVDVGTISRSSLPYRISKLAERVLLRNSEVIASLSNAGVREMRGWSAFRGVTPRFEVVSTYTNLALFRDAKKKGTGPFTLGYVGGAQGWYMIEPFLEVFRAVLKAVPDARLLVLNRYDHEFLRKKLHEFAIPESSVELKAVEHDQVASEMARMDCAAFFIRPSYSKIASAPTKLGELLACGIPCLTNCGVGDVEEILGESGSGVVLKNITAPEIEQGVAKLLALAGEKNTSERCQAAARKYFSLENGAANYARIYESLKSRP